MLLRAASTGACLRHFFLSALAWIGQFFQCAYEPGPPDVLPPLPKPASHRPFDLWNLAGTFIKLNCFVQFSSSLSQSTFLFFPSEKIISFFRRVIAVPFCRHLFSLVRDYLSGVLVTLARVLEPLAHSSPAACTPSLWFDFSSLSRSLLSLPLLKSGALPVAVRRLIRSSLVMTLLPSFFCEFFFFDGSSDRFEPHPSLLIGKRFSASRAAFSTSLPPLRPFPR